MPKSYSVTARNYGGGMNATSGAESLPPEALTLAQNMRFNKDGGVFTRMGFELKGSVGSSAKIDTIHTHEANDVMFCKSGTGIYHSLDGITWYSIGVTRTAGERDFFHSKGKDVYATNKTDGFLRISVSTLAASITGASVAIDLRPGDGDGFTNGAAVIYIEGDSINYTAVSTDQLTTVTNIAANHASGAIVTQTTSISSAPKGTCIGELEGSLLVGGVSANPSVLYYSAAATEANPEFAYDFTDNGAGSKLMPSDIKGIGTITGGVLIGMKKGIHYADSFQIDTGALVTIPISSSHSIPNAFCFAQADKKTYAYTGSRCIPIVNDVNGVRIEDYTEPGQDQLNIDYAVRSILNASDEDQTLSFTHFDPPKAEVSFSVIKDGISQELVLNEDLGKWSIDIGKVFGCKTNFKKRVFAGSDGDDSVFLDGELTTDNTIPILHRVLTPIYTQDDKRISSEYLKFTYGGMLSGAGSFTFRIYVGGQLALAEPVTSDDLIAKGLMSLSAGVPLGTGLVGTATIGYGGSSPTVYPFTFPYEMLLSGEQIQFEWEIFDEGTSFELRDSRLDAETSEELYSNTF
jgi:hypothetical protein